MTVASGSHSPNNEVDVVEWLSVDKARKRLTYPRDLLVVDCFEQFLKSGLTE
jgi:8-oxo-dGTP diphosphatase